ncbi:MAG: DNA ligase [Dehalococcoidaceae bacterium]|nr:DNA ligase [Dehalococcoidaceae bacterium]
MGLEAYNSKRDFLKTTEPSGSQKPAGASASRFVVQKHTASHLHYDFRLEMDGVLKSWAVPKGVPEQPGIRRLAVQTEDHPLDYITFEGVIPEGEYGAGRVEIWDSGTFVLNEKDSKKIEFALKGGKLAGSYVLIHTGEDNWLMLKKKGA